MKSKKLTPKQISGLVFLAVALVGVCATAMLALLPPSANTARAINLVTNGTSYGAIAAGVIAYYWAKNRQDS